MSNWVILTENESLRAELGARLGPLDPNDPRDPEQPQVARLVDWKGFFKALSDTKRANDRKARARDETRIDAMVRHPARLTVASFQGAPGFEFQYGLELDLMKLAQSDEPPEPLDRFVLDLDYALQTMPPRELVRRLKSWAADSVRTVVLRGERTAATEERLGDVLRGERVRTTDLGLYEAEPEPGQLIRQFLSKRCRMIGLCVPFQAKGLWIWQSMQRPPDEARKTLLEHVLHKLCSPAEVRHDPINLLTLRCLVGWYFRGIMALPSMLQAFRTLAEGERLGTQGKLNLVESVLYPFLSKPPAGSDAWGSASLDNELRRVQECTRDLPEVVETLRHQERTWLQNTDEPIVIRTVVRAAREALPDPIWPEPGSAKILVRSPSEAEDLHLTMLGHGLLEHKIITGSKRCEFVRALLDQYARNWPAAEGEHEEARTPLPVKDRGWVDSSALVQQIYGVQQPRSGDWNRFWKLAHDVDAELADTKLRVESRRSRKGQEARYRISPTVIVAGERLVYAGAVLFSNERST